MKEYFYVVLSLIVVVGLIFLTRYVLTKYNKKVNLSAGANIKIKEVMAVGMDKQLAIIEVCNSYMLISITSSGITKVADIPEGNVPDEYTKPVVAEKIPFKDAVAKIISNKFKGGE